MKLENPILHNEYTAVCSGNIVGIAQGGNGERHGKSGPFVICEGPSERSVLEENTHRDEKEYSSWSVWRETWASYAQVSGAVTHSQLQRQKKNYMGCLFREKVFCLQQIEMLSMGFCSPKRKPVTQVNRNLAP